MIERSSYAPLPGMNASAVQQIATVVEQERMARDTYRIRLRCPELAQQIVPGQFFMVRAAGESETILGRPFALYDVYEENGSVAGVDFGFVIVGKLTSQMPHWQVGDEAVVWGPLGNGFPVPDCERLVLVAGGIGQTPFLAVAREALGLRKYGRPPRMLSRLPKEVTLCYGVRSGEWLAGLNDFTLPGLDVRVSTDDGTFGHHGFVTELLAGELTPHGPDHVYCCGPEPMMHAVARLCAAANVPCWLSLESPMACGFGACFSCVTRVRTDGESWDYRRTCVEGPVFEAAKLVL